jgi:hypothetical protein
MVLVARERISALCFFDEISLRDGVSETQEDSILYLRVDARRIFYCDIGILSWKLRVLGERGIV